MWKKYLPFLVIVIIAIFFRTYHLRELPPGLYPDEAMNGSNALSAIHSGDFKIFYPENNGREGLFINLQALLVKWSGLREPWVLRSASAFFGILTVIGIYFLGKELFSRRVGLLASFLLATNFWHINFSRIGFRAIMAPAFAVWGVYLFILALRQDVGRKSLVTSILSGAVFGLGLHSYIAYRAMPALIVAIAVYLWFVRRDFRGEIIKRAALFVLTTFIVFLPLGIYFAKHPADFFGRTSQVSVFNSASPAANLGQNTLKTLGMFFVAGDYNWRHNISGKPELYLPVGLIFLLGIIFGIRTVFRKSSWQDGSVFPWGVLFAWFGIAMLPVVVSNEGLPHALRSILMIPPVMLIAAAGGNALYEFFLGRNSSDRSRGWLSFGVAFFAGLIVANAYTNYFVLWGKNPEVARAFTAEYSAIAYRINSLPRETPKYVIVEAGGVLVNGIPMPAEPVMFLTDTFRPEEQREKNVFYVLPGEREKVPAEALTFVVR